MASEADKAELDRERRQLRQERADLERRLADFDRRQVCTRVTLLYHQSRERSWHQFVGICANFPSEALHRI